MQFQTIVLVPKDTSDLMATVAEMMAPYDQAISVEPYRTRLDQAELERLAAALRLTSIDPETVIEAMRARFHEEGEEWRLDEEGMYNITDLNPRGEWDGWMLHHLSDDVWPVSTMPRDVEAWAVVTPDGEWHDLRRGWWEDTAEQRAERRRMAYDILDRYPNHLAVLLDCHA